jgi:WD40 repeat protein
MVPMLFPTWDSGPDRRAERKARFSRHRYGLQRTQLEGVVPISRIFLSHSSVNNREATALPQCLSRQNPRLANEIFLDTSPATGIYIGQRWREALNHAAARCEGVVCLLSKDWEKSQWCRWEYTYALQLGKQIFCARLEPDCGAELSEWQQSDLFGDGPMEAIDIGDGAPVLFSERGLKLLVEGIRRSGIGADAFEWPIDDPDRAPYRGWQPFEPVDAGIFCGRDAQIVRAMDAMRNTRKAKTEQWFVILGPSGSGKSSFLRAGLIPRMQRDDRDFLVLDIVRPERNVLLGANGLARAIHSARQQKGLTEPSLADIETACSEDAETVRRLLAELQVAARRRYVGTGDDGTSPTIVLPLDQAEELLASDGKEAAERFLELMQQLVAPKDGVPLDMIVAATIRSDRFEGLQTHPKLRTTGIKLFGELRPMPSDQYREVIKEPALRATADGRPLELAPDLVEKLVADCNDGGDTLPLLALTLSRLYEKHSASKVLTLAQYEDMGGLKKVVQTVIDGILDDDPSTRFDQSQLLREAFIPWLATVGDDDQTMRRVARWAELPETSLPLIDAFVANRLLVKDRRDNEDIVEVALESLLWQWDDLATWLSEAWRELKAVSDLERASAAWEHNSRHRDWLLAGSRLMDATTLAETPQYRDRLARTREYLDASRQAELRGSTSLQLVSIGREMLEGGRIGGDARAFKQLLAAHLLAETPDEGALYNAIIMRRTTLKIIETRRQNCIAFSPDGSRIVSGSFDRTLQLWDAHTGEPIGSPLTGHTDFVHSVAFSPDGHWIVSASKDNTLRLWDAGTGNSVGPPMIGHTAPVATAAFSPDGRRVVSGGWDNTLRLWNAHDGQPAGPPLTGHTNWVYDVAFSPDGHQIASGSRDFTVRLWDATTGAPVDAPLTGHSGAVFSVAFAPDGERIVSASGDDTLRLWDARAGRPVGSPLTGHTGPVNAAAFSPDGHRIVSAGADRTLRLWDADTRQPLDPPLTGHARSVGGVAFSPEGDRVVSLGDNTIRLWGIDAALALGPPYNGHTSFVTSVAFSPDGRRVISGSTDETLRLWNVDTLTPIGPPLTGHTAGVLSVAFSPDGGRIVSGSRDQTLRLWDADTGQPVASPLVGHTGHVHSVAFSPDGRQVVSGSRDDSLRLWDTHTGRPLGPPLVLPNGRSFAHDVAFSPDGRRIAAGYVDARVQLWDAGTGQPLGPPLTGHTDHVLSVAFSADGRRVVSGSRDKTLRLWDATTGQPIGRPLTGHTDFVHSAVFSPDGQRIVSGSRDWTLRLWDATTGQPIGPPLTGHTDPVLTVAFSPDGRFIVSGSDDRTVRLWDGDTGAYLDPHLTSHTGVVTSVAFSPDGRLIVSGSYDNTLRLWDGGTGAPLGPPLTGHTGFVNSVAFTPDSNRIVSGSSDKTLRLWDATTGEPIGTPLTAHSGSVHSVAFSPDGNRIVSGSFDKTVRLWDATTGEPIGTPFTAHSGPVGCVAFSPDGRHIVSGSDDNTLRLWDGGTGELLGEPLTGHTNDVLSVAFSPDGRRIASSSRDHTVRIWDSSTFRPLGSPLIGHGESVNSVAFSPDGQRIASGSLDTTVRLWHAHTGTLLGPPLTGHSKSVDSVAFSPDGRRVVSGSVDTTLRLWPADARPEDLCTKLTQNITRNQWREWVSPDIPYMEICPGLPIPPDEPD